MQLSPLLLAGCLASAWPGCLCDAAPATSEVQSALRKATDYLTSIATEGGYLWRYSRDLDERFGETRATSTQIWVQPPGTPAVGMAFLDAYGATKDECHLAAAQAAANALVRGQLASGGWAYLVEFDPKARRSWAYRADGGLGSDRTARKKNTTTYDDDNTQGALRFLLAFLGAATNRPPEQLKAIREALNYGLAKMLAAQYPNGAWPQRHEGEIHDARIYPVQPARIPGQWSRDWPKTDYGSYYTLNDHTQRDCIRTMIEAWKRMGNREYLSAARRGGDFLTLAQLPEPQPAWAQQYNFAMEPAWARAFEPPAVCSSESAAVMRVLVDLFLETGDERFLQPLPSSIAWFQRSQLTPGQWARFYELGTNKPIFGDRDGKVHYTLKEISTERQRGYSWQGTYDIPEAIAYYESVKAQGRERLLATRRKASRPAKHDADQVARILEQQDSAGRWLVDGWVDLRRFNANIHALARYLAAP